MAHKLLFKGSYINWWCIEQEVCHQMRDQVIADDDNDIRSELQRLNSSGVDTLEGLVESFQVSHRGRQYMNGQLGICRSIIPIINPFSNANLVAIACALPLSEKVHNQVNQKILRRLAPNLLRYPMAATLVPANWPIGLQEVSRGARKAVEAMRWRMYQLGSEESQRKPNLGWVNFQFLRDSTLFHDIIESLNSDFWDKPRMHQTVREYPNSSLHPLYDMLCKIKTIDFGVSSDSCGGSPK
jgi:hypothetical protein